MKAALGVKVEGKRNCCSGLTLRAGEQLWQSNLSLSFSWEGASVAEAKELGELAWEDKSRLRLCWKQSNQPSGRLKQIQTFGEG